MTFLSKTKDFIFGKKTRTVYTPIEPDLIKRDDIIKRQQQKNQTLIAQLSEYKAKEKLLEERKKERDEESEFNKKLKEQGLDLQANLYGKVVWFGKFYNDILIKRKKHFKERPIEITDKNDEVVIGKFGDFGIMDGGKFCLKDSDGKIVSAGNKLSQVLYKPDAFFNMVKRGRFTIPVDKDGNWMEDIDYKQIPVPLDSEFDEETGKIKWIQWSKVKTSEVKRIIAQKMEEIHFLSNELERVENVVSKQKLEIDDLNRTNKVLQINSDSNQTNLSKATFQFNEINKRFSDIHNQNVKLIELKAINEGLVNQYQSIFDRLLTKLESLSEPKYKLIKAELMDDLEYYKQILPERVEIKQDAPKLEQPIAMPGDVIKK